jgi:hypothetical protein
VLFDIKQLLVNVAKPTKLTYASWWPVRLPPGLNAIKANLSGGNVMYAVVRQAQLKPGMSAEFTAKADQSAQAMTSQLAGFKAFYIIAGEGDNMCTVSVFESKAQADAAQAAVGEQLQAAFAPFLASVPTAMSGAVAVAKTF